MSKGKKHAGAVTTRAVLDAMSDEARFRNAQFPGETIPKSYTRNVKPSEEGYDPRFHTPTQSSPRKGAEELQRLKDLEFTKEKTVIEKPEFNIVDHEGRGIISTQSDRSAAGTTITHINGEELSEPIVLQGGQDYMFENDAVWASNKGPVEGIVKMANDLKAQTGKDPIFAPHTMAPTGTDFATMIPELMIKVARQRMSPTDIAELNKLIRDGMRKIDGKETFFKEFVGIEHPDAVRQLSQVTGNQRKKIITDLDLFRGRGGLSSPEARLIITDPAQYGSVDGQLHNVGIVHAGKSPQQTFAHNTYPWEVPGEGIGQWKQTGERAATSFDLIPEGKNIGDKKNPTKTWQAPEQIAKQHMRGMSMNQKMQANIIDNNMLRQLDDRGLLSKKESQAVNKILNKEDGFTTLPVLAGLGVLSATTLAGITAFYKHANNLPQETDNKTPHGTGTVLLEEGDK
jgi:hypothetical protein